MSASPEFTLEEAHVGFREIRKHAAEALEAHRDGRIDDRTFRTRVMVIVAMLGTFEVELALRKQQAEFGEPITSIGKFPL
jgi:hypothetical protein